MKKARQYASEILVAYTDTIFLKNIEIFKKKMAEVLKSITINEIEELIKTRNVTTDNGLLSILKEQRQKYKSICNIVDIAKQGLLLVTDFDSVIEKIYPSIYEWYCKYVLELGDK